jgi:hypothetical protein
MERLRKSAIEVVEEFVRLIELLPQYGGASRPLVVTALCSSMDIVAWRPELVGYLGDRGAQRLHEHPSLLHPSIFGHVGILPRRGVPRVASIARRLGNSQLNAG